MANYFARTINTVARVGDVVRTLIDPIKIIKNFDYTIAIINNLENLHDELGNGREKRPHVVLMTEWINTLLEKLGSNILPIEDNYHKFITKETEQFTHLQESLYNSKSVVTVIGASFAQELFAHHMMQKLFDGYLKNYHYLFKIPDEFLKTQLYFTVHTDGTEENHAKLISSIISLTCKNIEDLEEIDLCYKQFEKITIMFWAGIYNKIQSLTP